MGLTLLLYGKDATEAHSNSSSVVLSSAPELSAGADPRLGTNNWVWARSIWWLIVLMAGGVKDLSMKIVLWRLIVAAQATVIAIACTTKFNLLPDISSIDQLRGTQIGQCILTIWCWLTDDHLRECLLSFLSVLHVSRIDVKVGWWRRGWQLVPDHSLRVSGGWDHSESGNLWFTTTLYRHWALTHTTLPPGTRAAAHPDTRPDQQLFSTGWPQNNFRFTVTLCILLLCLTWDTLLI